MRASTGLLPLLAALARGNERCNDPPDQCDQRGGDAEYEESVITLNAGGAAAAQQVGGTRRVLAEGCPNNDPLEVCVGRNPNPATRQGWDMTVPATPRFARPSYEESLASPVDLSAQGGFIGIVVNSVDILSCYAGSRFGRCVGWETSAPYIEGDSFEYCGGHGSPYHYHNVPSCLLQQMGLRADGSSPQLGWAVDGFPVMGNRGPGGVLMQSCGMPGAHPTICVDRCGGLYGEFAGDAFLYRYYLMGPDGDMATTPIEPLPGPEFFPFSPYCLVGCGEMSIDSRSGDTNPSVSIPSCTSASSAGTVDGFDPLATILEGVTEPYRPIPTADAAASATASAAGGAPPLLLPPAPAPTGQGDGTSEWRTAASALVLAVGGMAFVAGLLVQQARRHSHGKLDLLTPSWRNVAHAAYSRVATSDDSPGPRELAR